MVDLFILLGLSLISLILVMINTVFKFIGESKIIGVYTIIPK